MYACAPQRMLPSLSARQCAMAECMDGGAESHAVLPNRLMNLARRNGLARNLVYRQGCTWLFAPTRSGVTCVHKTRQLKKKEPQDYLMCVDYPRQPQKFHQSAIKFYKSIKLHYKSIFIEFCVTSFYCPLSQMWFKGSSQFLTIRVMGTSQKGPQLPISYPQPPWNY
jgi:hypothetical protein